MKRHGDLGEPLEEAVRWLRSLPGSGLISRVEFGRYKTGQGWVSISIYEDQPYGMQEKVVVVRSGLPRPRTLVRAVECIRGRLERKRGKR